MATERNSLAARVGRLEREARRARRLARGAVLVAACWPLLAWMQDSKPIEVRAAKFVLVDASDRARAELRLDNGTPGLFLTDMDGKTRVRLTIAKDEDAGLILTDKQGRKRLGVVVDAYGYPHVVLNDEAQRPRAHLALGPKGAPGLVCANRGGQRLAGVGVNPEGKAWLLPGFSRQKVPEDRPDKK